MGSNPIPSAIHIMEITRVGKLPSENLYKGTCSNCHCEVKFKEGEAKVETFDDPRESQSFTNVTVKCPTPGCNYTIFGRRC